MRRTVVAEHNQRSGRKSFCQDRKGYRVFQRILDRLASIETPEDCPWVFDLASSMNSITENRGQTFPKRERNLGSRTNNIVQENPATGNHVNGDVIGLIRVLPANWCGRGQKTAILRIRILPVQSQAHSHIPACCRSRSCRHYPVCRASTFLAVSKPRPRSSRRYIQRGAVHVHSQTL